MEWTIGLCTNLRAIVSVDGETQLERALFTIIAKRFQRANHALEGFTLNRQPYRAKARTFIFYIAQLHHYGLQPLTTGQVAKKTSLAAWNGSSSNLMVLEHMFIPAGMV